MSALFVAAGEALIDLIQQPDGRYEACLGGSVFNFCVALARLRVPTAYANPLSRDPFGRRFAQRLQGRFGLPVALVDERLTSREAESMLRAAGVRGARFKAGVDSVAAQRLLEAYFAGGEL